MKKIVFFVLTWILFVAASASAVRAAPRFTINPATGSYPVGQTFKVTVGLDSEAVPIISADVVIDFNATKLEAVSVEPVLNPGFAYDSNNFVPIIHNDTGKIEITLPPSDPSALAGVTARGDLLAITFKGKTIGTAAVSYNCQADSVKESNIISNEAVDVVSCSANQSGSYDITGSFGGETSNSGALGTTTVPTPKAELPKTGTTENTLILSAVGLAILGLGKYIIGLK